MAITQPEIEWFYDYTHTRVYGLMNLAGKWAVVKHREYRDNYDLVTDWLNDRKTAVGFLKLLMEK